MRGLRSAIARQSNQKKKTLLLAHFPASFEEIESVLLSLGLDFEVLARGVGTDTFTDLVRTSQLDIYLTLADMVLDSGLTDERRQPTGNWEAGDVGIIVTELHPLPEKDARIEQFARQLPLRVRLGYFLSLEDPVISRLTNKATVSILAQLGLGDNDLISSHMVSRQIRRAMKRSTLTQIADTSSHSAEEWYEANTPRASNID